MPAFGLIEKCESVVQLRTCNCQKTKKKIGVKSKSSSRRRCKSKQIFSAAYIRARVCVQWAWREQTTPRHPTPTATTHPRLTYEPGKTRAADKSDGSISATPPVSLSSSSSSSSFVPGSIEEPQPLTQLTRSDPILARTRLVDCGDTRVASAQDGAHGRCDDSRADPL